MISDTEKDGSVRPPMFDDDGPVPAKPLSAAAKAAEERRRQRSAEQLRANLARRKQQARARRAGDEDGRDGKLTQPASSDNKS